MRVGAPLSASSCLLLRGVGDFHLAVIVYDVEGIIEDIVMVLSAQKAVPAVYVVDFPVYYVDDVVAP